MEDTTRRWVCQRLPKWYSHQMLWWQVSTGLPSDIYVFSRLPWEVHIHFNLMQDTESLLGRCRVLIATIRDKGSCPCPQCLVPKTDLYRISFLSDMSQRILKVRSYLHDKVAAARAVAHLQCWGADQRFSSRGSSQGKVSSSYLCKWVC